MYIKNGENSFENNSERPEECFVCEEKKETVTYRKVIQEKNYSAAGFFACDECYSIYKGERPYRLSASAILHAVCMSMDKLCKQVA